MIWPLLQARPIVGGLTPGLNYVAGGRWGMTADVSYNDANRVTIPFDDEIWADSWSYTGSSGVFTVPSGVDFVAVIARAAVTFGSRGRGSLELDLNSTTVHTQESEGAYRQGHLSVMLPVSSGDTLEVTYDGTASRDLDATYCMINLLGYEET